MKRRFLLLAVLCAVALPVRAQIQIPPAVQNAGSTGTSANHLVKLTGAPSTAVIAVAGDTQGIVGICDSTCGTSSSPIIATAGVDVCAFDGSTTAGDYVQISATIAGDCTDTGSAAVPTSGEIIGRVLTSIGSAGNASIVIGLENSVGGGGGSGGVGAGNTGQIAAYNSSNTVTSIPLAIYPDALTSAGGVGSASQVWASGTTYPLCQVVSHSGNFIATSAGNGTTIPGANPHIWYPIPNGSRPTAFDCAAYIAMSQTTSTVAPTIQLGAGVYNSCIGVNYPTVAAPGLPLPAIRGVGKKVSGINQTCTLLSGSGGDGLAIINVPPAAVSSALPSIQFSDFYIEANALGVPFDLHACQQCSVQHVELRDGALGDHFMEIGTVGGAQTGWVYELTMQDVTEVYNPGTYGTGHGNGAFAATVAVSGGVPTITVTNPGNNYSSANTTFRLVRAGGLEACTSVGTFTPTFSGNTITALTTTSTGCAATGSTFVQPFPQILVTYGFTFSNMSDSNFIAGLVPGGVGTTCGINISNVSSFNKFYNLHPIATFNGVCNQGTNDFYSTQLDTIYNWGIDEEGQGDVANYYNSKYEWAASNLEGSSDFHLGKTTGAPTNAPASINIYTEQCGNTPFQDAYGHFVMPLGVVDNTSNVIPAFFHAHEPQYCNIKNSNTIEFSSVANPISWGMGNNSNHWDWTLGTGFNATLTLANVGGTNTNPWTWFVQNSNPATSGANQKSPVFGAQGAYWDGSVSQLFGWQIQSTCAAGTGPLCTFAFKKVGTTPAGSYQWTFDAPTLLPTGSTAVTQSTGDTSTDIATDAFVANNIAIAVGATGCLLNCNYVLTQGDSPEPGGGNGTTMTGANTGQYTVFYNPLQRKLGKACVRVTTIGAAGHFDVGVYSISGTTGTLIWDAGSQSTASTGNICVTPSSVTLNSGTNYIIAWCADNTSATLVGITNSGAAGSLMAGAPAHTFGTDATDACSAGVLPGTITTTNITNSSSASIPVILATN